MKTIYKYKVNLLDDTTIRGRISKVLTVQYQQNTEQIVVWAEIDPYEEEADWLISSYGTGHAIPEDVGDYIGTIQFYTGELVAHYFAMKL